MRRRLKQVASVVARSTCRASDLAVRYGGEEPLVLLGKPMSPGPQRWPNG